MHCGLTHTDCISRVDANNIDCWSSQVFEIKLPIQRLCDRRVLAQGLNILLERPLTIGVRPAVKVADFGLARTNGPWSALQAHLQGINHRWVPPAQSACFSKPQVMTARNTVFGWLPGKHNCTCSIAETSLACFGMRNSGVFQGWPANMDKHRGVLPWRFAWKLLYEYQFQKISLIALVIMRHVMCTLLRSRHMHDPCPYAHGLKASCHDQGTAHYHSEPVRAL